MGKKHLSRKAVEGLITARMADSRTKNSEFTKLAHLYVQLTAPDAEIRKLRKVNEITVREAQEELAQIPKPTSETDLIRQIEKQKKEEKQ